MLKKCRSCNSISIKLVKEINSIPLNIWPQKKINYKNFKKLEKNKHFNSNYPVAFIVSISPDQTYFPKISSKALKSGKLISNPIHLMSPDLDKSVEKKVFKYL